MAGEMPLDALAAEWRALKSAEEELREKRLAVEHQICGATGVRDEGAKTHEAGRYSITVKGSLTRSMDWEVWRRIEASIPPDLRPVKLVEQLDEPRVKYLQANEPELYAKIAAALTVKPAKPYISIKLQSEASA